MREGKFWFKLLVAGLLTCSLALAGCSGDDGPMGPAGLPGADGAAGAPGAPGADGAAGAPGADGVAGADGADGAPGVPGANGVDGINGINGTDGADGATKLANAHAVTSIGATTNVTSVTASASNVVIKANVKLDGVDRNDFGTVVSVASYTLGTTGANVYNSSSTATAVSEGNGNYTITVTPSATWVSDVSWTPTKDTTWMVRLNTGAGINYPEANIVANQTASGKHVRNVISNQACVNCHGKNIFKEAHPSRVYHNSSYGAQSCVTCHTHSTRNNLLAYAHGIHNSHNMAERSITSGTVTVTKPAGVYARNNSTNSANWYEVTYPTYMQNCSVCHDTQESLDYVNSRPVTYDLCMSCHDSWAGFSFIKASAAPFKTIHQAMTAATNCASCHEGAVAPKSVKDFHNGLQTERAGVIWDGKDVSVVEGAKVDMQITGVSRVANDLLINWTAKYDGVAVDPCNAVATTSAPAFFAAAANATTGQAAGGFSILRSYTQGDDPANAGIGTAPGQPLSTNLTVANTVCAANVATSTIALTATEIATTATKGTVAIQGKAQLDHSALYPGLDSNLTAAGVQSVDQVRSKTPTREFMVADGALPAVARRAIVDTAACLKCHVGSLYQHGGNRIDNVDMCVMCHNEASNEKNVRVNDGVDATEAYDGKSGQTYGFKSLLHAVHSAGVNGAITMVYRTNGIYVWAGHDTALPATWPGTGPQTVYGSNPAGTNPLGTTRTHNLHVTTYPQTLKNCQACHKPGTEALPNQGKAIATTVDAGLAPWDNQLDDTLRGPASAACLSCHQLPDRAENAKIEAHAAQNGFYPSVFVNGRLDVLNFNRGTVETCVFCHK